MFLSNFLEKANDLVMDDDVEGETTLGSGKTVLTTSNNPSDIIPASTTVQRQHLTKRPLSAKQKAGAIVSNNDVSFVLFFLFKKIFYNFF